jgi:predicted unusual protein kinase regulating ubiquinone biosynthesis (AarF/ABC1/UbiB family)
MSARPPPRSGLARGLRVGSAALAAGALSIGDRLRSTRPAEPEGARLGRVMLAALLDLRGAALKIAQFLSLESDLLPEGAARELAQACHRVPPMSPQFARDMVQSQVGPIGRHFGSFEPAPFAAASLGQVHAATSRRGVPLAVKIQYPGMPETIHADVHLLRRVLGAFRHAAHYRRLLDEIETRLLEECDYEQEAERAAWFRERIAVDGVTVPEVVPELSASGVLTTTRLAGRHVDEWLAGQPSPQERDLAAQRLYDVFVQSLHVHGCLHADPNPGNVLFGNGGTVGLLDFGCTRRIPPDCQDLITRTWRAAVAADDDAAQAAHRDMGLFAHLSKEQARELDQASVQPFRRWLAIPFLTERFDFGAQPGFVSEGRRLLARMLRDEALVGIRPEFILVNRTLYGWYRVFERLQARVCCQTEWTAA